MKKQEGHFDLAGEPFYPGALVVYAALWDRSAVLKYGIVTRLKRRQENDYMTWSARACIGKVPTKDGDYTVGVITVDRVVFDGWKLQKDGKEITLGFLDRMLVVHQDMVPKEAAGILIARYLEIEKKGGKDGS